jgi:flavorubredoxin
VLIDTGMGVESAAFQETLRSVIDPGDLKWIYLTHPHPDHTGSVHALLNEVPGLRVITTFAAFGLMSVGQPVAMDRVYLLNPGETLDVGDRQIVAMRPPTFDDATTTCFFDTKSKALFSSDSFGALLLEEAERAEEVRHDTLAGGQRLWASFDSPWLQNVDASKFQAGLKSFEDLDASWILSAHLPPAANISGVLLDTLAGLPGNEPFVGPNQAALEAMLSGAATV